MRDQIASIIEDKAMKQSTIAARAGLTPDKLCATLKGRRRMDANELLRVCAAMDMTPEQVANYQPKKGV